MSRWLGHAHRGPVLRSLKWFGTGIVVLGLLGVAAVIVSNHVQTKGRPASDSSSAPTYIGPEPDPLSRTPVLRR